MSCGAGCGCGCNLISSLQSSVDSALGIRDQLGIKIHDVFLLTRTWTGTRPGDGSAKDSVEQLLPTPKIVDYSHNLRLQEGGTIRQGDIILKGVSKGEYPDESVIDGSSHHKNIEHFYLIDDRLYNVINVKENYFTWDVQLRKLADKTRY